MTDANGRTPGGRLRRGAVVLWIPAIVVAAVIFALSSLPGVVFPHVEFHFADKLAHATIFGVLAILVAVPLRRLGVASKTTWIVLFSTLLVLAYGISDEVHQMYTPMRSPDVLDVVADTVGGFLAVLAYCVWKSRSGSMRSSSA